MILQNKKEIRKHFRKQRQQISSLERNQASLKAADIFIQSSIFRDNQSFACYIPNDHEFDSQAIIGAIWRAGKDCYLPLLVGTEEKHLNFAYYSPATEMKSNRYNILEPQHSVHINKPSLDVVIMPLVSFDLQGNRLGMGGGYYDRTFSFLVNSKKTKPLLIGLAFENQCVEQLPCDEWDVKMQAVLTEKKFHFFGR